MKRIRLNRPSGKPRLCAAPVGDEDTPQNIGDCIAELRLLHGVPFFYLIPDETLLPKESIRFFHLDENWLDALTDGALSVGRVSGLDAETDDLFIKAIVRNATEKLARPRFAKTHENHRGADFAHNVFSRARTGLVLRSDLVGKWKGPEAFGYNGDALLKILRMEALTSEILLCIFDGELTKFVISEPTTGLRFGAPDHSGVITLRGVSDDENFGKPIKGGTVDLNAFTEANGRIRAADLARHMRERLAAPFRWRRRSSRSS